MLEVTQPILNRPQDLSSKEPFLGKKTHHTKIERSVKSPLKCISISFEMASMISATSSYYVLKRRQD